MAPAVTLDNSSDFHHTPSTATTKGTMPRTLLLSPPSLSSHPERLEEIRAAHDRDATDIQMLDRLSMNLVSLPAETYDIILILTDADNSRRESQALLSSQLLSTLVKSLKAAGHLASQDNAFAATEDSTERREAIFAGLIVQDGKMVKPDYASTAAVPLRLGKKNTTATTSPAGTGAVSLNLTGKRKNGPPDATQPAGVGFVDFSDDFNAPVEEEYDDDDLIDEDTLLSDEDLARPIVQRKPSPLNLTPPCPQSWPPTQSKKRKLTQHTAPECRPQTGKRRRACKDCTCGLAARLEAEDAAKRAAADAALSKLHPSSTSSNAPEPTTSNTTTTARLNPSDLAEVDFTVQGKVGSCGNCALGDAFRCDGCPYIGLPAFKNGEEVRLVNSDVQL